MIDTKFWLITGILWAIICVTDITDINKKRGMPIRGIIAEGMVAYVYFLRAFSI